MNVELKVDNSNAWSFSYISCDEYSGELTLSGEFLLSSPPEPDPLRGLYPDIWVANFIDSLGRGDSGHD